MSAVRAALGGATPEQASLEETTDPSDAHREDSGEDFVPGDAGVSAGGDDVEDDGLELASDDEDADVDLDAQAEETDAGDEASDSDETESGESDKSATGDIEEVDVTDDLGRRKVKVDFSNREYMRKVVQQAAGARKLMRVEIPKLKQAAEAAQAEAATHKEDASHFKGLAEAWDKGGVAGLVEKLTQGKQTWDQVYEAETARRKQLASMSPAERAAADAEARVTRAEAGKTEAEKKLEAKLKELDERSEKAERDTLQNYMETSFTKSRFAGTLGDEAREHELDELLWDGVRAAISKLPDDVSVTPQLIAQTFARKSSALKSTIASEAGKKAKDAAGKKKADAKAAAQSTMRAATSGGGKPAGVEREFRKQMKTGNLVTAVTDFLIRTKKK